MSIISYDAQEHRVNIRMPDKASQYANQLRDDLEAEFAFEGMGLKTLTAMNRYAQEWLAGHGIDVEIQA